MILFDDSSWKYSFVILMTIIIIGSGIYTFFKYYRSQKVDSPKKENTNIDYPNIEENILIKKEEVKENIILDEDSIIKKKSSN